MENPPSSVSTLFSKFLSFLSNSHLNVFMLSASAPSLLPGNFRWYHVQFSQLGSTVLFHSLTFPDWFPGSVLSSHGDRFILTASGAPA